MIAIHEALRIAVEALGQTRAPMHLPYKLTASRVDDQWVFWFAFLPPTPGMDCTVVVGDDGKPQVTVGF